MTESWYDKSLEQIERRFSTDRTAGLKAEQVVKSRREYGRNHIYTSPKSSFFGDKTVLPFSFASLILLITMLCAYVFRLDMSVSGIVLMILIQYAAAVIIFVKAKNVLEGMVTYSLPTAKVIRDGVLTLVEMQSLVPGDVICLSVGDIVPADCRLTETDGLWINERMLTGAVVSVQKNAAFHHFAPGLSVSGQQNMAFATMVVTAGRGRGIVVATGKETLAAQSGRLKKITTHDNLKILSILKNYCHVWSLVMLVLVMAMMIFSLAAKYSGDLFSTFVGGIAMAAASMAELFGAFGYMIIGCGVFNAMKRKKEVNVGALIKNTEKLEVLRDIDCLVLPKDGIMTQLHNYAERLYIPRRLYSATDRQYLAAIRSLVLGGVISTGIYSSGLQSLNQNSRRITPEEEAIIELASNLGLYNSSIDRSHPIIEHTGAGGASKFETTLTLDGNARYMAVCRGEADAILKSCEYYTKNGSIYRMSTDERLEFLGIAQSLMKSSYKIVAVASGVTGYNNLTRIGAIQSDLTFEGLIALREPLQPGVAQLISRCQTAGIKLIMTTEHYTENDKYMAMSVGLIKDESNILTDIRLQQMNQNLLRTNLPLYNLYCGIPSRGMATIVRMLREDGHKVGLLAGGTDGALLLRSADVGFAQSVTISPKASKTGIDIRSRQTPIYSRVVERGKNFDSEAIKFISDVVVSDADEHGGGGFSAVVSAIAFSRSIYDNILRTIRYLATTQMSRILVLFGAILLGTTVLSPVQLIFGGLMVDFFAVACSAFAKPTHDILQKHEDAETQLQKPLLLCIRPFIFAAFRTFTLLAIIPIWDILGLPETAGGFMTVVFVSFTVCQLIDFTEFASERSLFAANLTLNLIYCLFVVFTLGVLALGFILPDFGAYMGMVRLYLPETVACAVIPALNLLIHEVYKLIQRKKR